MQAMDRAAGLPTRRTTRQTLPLELGRALRRARDRRSMTAEEVAKRVGVSTAHVGALERGHRAPSTVLAARLVAALGLPPGVAGPLLDAAVPDAGLSR